MKNQAVQRKLGMRDKQGGIFGDFGNDLTFVLASTYLLKFYTDVMGVRGAAMGQIVDQSKPTNKGEILPWIRRMCGPVAVASAAGFCAARHRASGYRQYKNSPPKSNMLEKLGLPSLQTPSAL